MESLGLADLGNINMDNVTKGGTIPEGWYQMKAEKADMKTTKAGTGQYINCRFVVSGGDKYLKAGFFQMFNIKNPSEVAQNIGLSQLKEFQEAALGRELSNLVAFDDVIGRDVMAKVSIRSGSGAYGDQNTITKFKAMGKQ